MRRLRELWSRFRGAVSRAREEHDLPDEIAFHIQMQTDDNIRAGMLPEAARRAARLKFGNVESVKERHRDQRGLPWLEGLTSDFRLAIRRLQQDRTYTLAGIATLAVAIGLNVTVFTVMNAMLFRGFPLVKENDRLLYMQERYPSGLCCISYPDFEAWRADAQAFEDMAFLASTPITFRTGDGRALDVAGGRTVSNNTFRLLGVPPMLGRDFLPSDELLGAPPVVILSYRFWETAFNRRSDIIGLTVHINDEPTAVIGVMPEGFEFPEERELWLPLQHTPTLLSRGPGGYMAFGRLRDGVTLEEARTELKTINLRLEAAYPATNRGVVPRVDTYSQFFIGPDAPIIYGSLWAAAWFVLLIACANLANLTLARTTGRWREFATRMALGAGLGRMIRQILVESFLLASLAGALGWWITVWGVHAWAVQTASRFQVLDYRVDSDTLAYLLAVSLGSAILFSILPASRVREFGVNGALKGDARGTTQGAHGKRLAAGLVAAQMMLAVVLLSGAGVLVRSLLNVVEADTGVRDPQNVLVGSVRLLPDAYPDAAARLRYFDRLNVQLRNVRGIATASLSSTIPVDSGRLRVFELGGRVEAQDGSDSVQFLSVGPDYFRAVGRSVISGREFRDSDQPASLPVAIVNESFAATYLPGQQLLGRRLRVKDGNKLGDWREVVGVTPNIMQGDPTRQHFKPLVYLPFRQEPVARAFFLLRTEVAPAQVAQTVRADVQDLDPNVILADFSSLKETFAFQRDRMDLEHAEMGKHAAAAPIFALIALLLAAVGLYAVIAHSVSQRTKEIGIRMAIGAAKGDIRGMILRDGIFPVAVGMILGLAVSLGMNRILQSQLVGVSPYDPATMTGAPIILVLVALLASWMPARRAVQVDPVVALRHD